MYFQAKNTLKIDRYHIFKHFTKQTTNISFIYWKGFDSVPLLYMDCTNTTPNVYPSFIGKVLIQSLYYTWIAPIVHQKLLQPLPSINRTLIFPT
jgi:hypothetical protein